MARWLSEKVLQIAEKRRQVKHKGAKERYPHLNAEFIITNAELEEAQAGRNINNLRYADDTTLMAESEEELKSLLVKVKEESEKLGLKLNI